MAGELLEMLVEGGGTRSIAELQQLLTGKGYSIDEANAQIERITHAMRELGIPEPR